MEAQIYPLALYLDGDDVVFNHDFFYNAPNCLTSQAIAFLVHD